MRTFHQLLSYLYHIFTVCRSISLQSHQQDFMEDHKNVSCHRRESENKSRNLSQTINHMLVSVFDNTNMMTVAGILVY